MHCCARLTEPELALVYVAKLREYGVRVLDGGSSYVTIQFCPWCGTRLPPSLRAEWFATLDGLGLEPGEEGVPRTSRRTSGGVARMLEARMTVTGPHSSNTNPQLVAALPAFDWDVRKVWALQQAVTSMPLGDLEYLLDLPMWSSRRGEGMLFDLAPRAVLTDPEASRYHWRRIQEADTSFPIDLLGSEDDVRILDGLHRLARHAVAGTPSIPVRVHHADCVPFIRVGPRTWE